MEKILVEFTDIIKAEFGAVGLWFALILLGAALCFITWERFSKAKNATADNNFKRFDVLNKVLEGDIKSKQPLLIEQAFSNYFGFTLSGPDIQYAFNVTKPTDFIIDMKYARTLVKFDDKNNKYIPDTLIPLRVKKFFANLTFWAFGLIGYVSFGFLVVSKEVAWLVPSILFFFLFFVSLHFVKPIYAAIRVCKAYQPRPEKSLIEIPK